MSENLTLDGYLSTLAPERRARIEAKTRELLADYDRLTHPASLTPVSDVRHEAHVRPKDKSSK